MHDNPLRRGWSREVISGNIAEMMSRKGYAQDQAVAAALSSARRSYRQRHPRGSMPGHLRRNPSVSLTYGKMPSKDAFEKAFERRVADGVYTISLSRSDARAADGTSIGDGVYDADELYDGVKELVDKWADHEDDRAGDLASAILSTLGFKWI
jgi:hypothetical protein